MNIFLDLKISERNIYFKKLNKWIENKPKEKCKEK